MSVIVPFGLTLAIVLLAWRFGGLKPDLLFPLLITTGVAITGWRIGDTYSRRRDRANKQRDLRIQYLIEAYRRIELVCARDNPADVSADMARGLESAIADIQLFGSARQVELARKAVKEVETSSYSDPRELLAELRADLRGELELEPASADPSSIMHFRIKKVLPKRAANDAPK